MEGVKSIKALGTYGKSDSKVRGKELKGGPARTPAFPECKLANPSRVGPDMYEKAVENILRHVNSARTDLQFKVHESTGEIIIRVVSREDGRVVREVPSEETLDLAARIEKLAGILLNKRA